MSFVRVQCYSGAKANERPIRFELDGREYMVDDVIEQWYGPEDAFFKVRADDENIYVLRYSPVTDVWSLESVPNVIVTAAYGAPFKLPM
jgi:hypothetical protein